MLDIWKDIQNINENYTGYVIARVVSTWGSAPRQSGSALLISPKNEIIGSVSGGCIESEVIQKAEEVRSTRAPAVCTFGVSDELAWSVGLSCGGTVKVYIEPFWADTLNHGLWESLHKIINDRKSCVLVTQLTPNPLNALINKTGIISEVNGELPAEVIEKASALIDKSHNELTEINGNTYFFHSLPTPAKMIIIGAGHISKPLSRFALDLGFTVTVIDPRTAFIWQKPSDLEEIELINTWPEAYFSQLTGFDNLYVALISHDPKIDDPVYPFLFKNDIRYIGALGGRKTNEKRKIRLKEAGFSESQIDRIHCPIGLSINAKSAGEIALSIMAEIIQVKNS